jgi:hypothetical protein
MFIQVIEGTTSDTDAVHRQMEIWERDLLPGAIGYLGSAGGCTADGACVIVARFESREAAQRNSGRPEQSSWWEATEQCFDGPVTFHDSEDVQMLTHGRIEDATFVQVMEGHVTDRERAAALEQEFDPLLAEARPDLLGSITAFHGDGEYTDVAYFTSEQEARAAERGEMPPEVAEKFGEWQDVMRVERYLDITEPWLVPAGGNRT